MNAGRSGAPACSVRASKTPVCSVQRAGEQDAGVQRAGALAGIGGTAPPFELVMNPASSRRSFLYFTGTAVVSACVKAQPRRDLPILERTGPLGSIEQHLGGRVGVFATELGTGRSFAYRQDERFALCSTFKWVLAAAVLDRVDRGVLSLERAIGYGERDLVTNSPVTSSHVGEGRMSIAALAEAIVTTSDNTAANLLLGQIGGPPGVTQFLRDLGDPTTRLDRDEPTMGTNLPGDARDTTTPRAMATNLRQVLTENVLSLSSRDRLVGWMVACKTGLTRLRAGLPAGWRAGDKTGTGANGACNDVAVIWPPRGAPWFVASYLSESHAAEAELHAAHVEIARTLVGWIG